MKHLFEEDDIFLAKWLNGDLTAEELAAFEASDDYEMYKKIAGKTTELKPEGWDKTELWGKIAKEANIPNSHKKVENSGGILANLPAWSYAAAACMILLVAYLTLFRSGSQIESYRTLAAENKMLTLPDGSIAHLNAVSQLSFDKDKFLNNRSLTLKGEAFFEVKRGSYFTVETDQGDVRVLGTSFNVRSRSSGLDVTCYSGKVGVSFDEFINQEILSKGQKLRSSRKKVQSIEPLSQMDEKPNWKLGRSKFENTAFAEVISEMERQFNIEVEVPDDVKAIEDYNGGFDHDNMQKALEIISSSVNCTFAIQDNKVVLQKK